ncbi:tetratricopeptide repeat protein [Streptosporangium sp. NPDC004379]|uniref:tetratricopeptide repeat protein n=1 Tax=Streptosporangium sp. NPDC004379 TaxID=3366189 RepID=UPI0036A8A808
MGVTVSVLALTVGLVGFFADPLHLPDAVLDVLDKRASVLSLFVGVASLVVAGVGLLTQLREQATPSSDAPAVPAASSSGPGSPVVGGAMAGGMVVGQVSGGTVTGPGGAAAGAERAVAVTGDLTAGMLITGDGATITTTTAEVRPPLPPADAVQVPVGGLAGLPRRPAGVFVGRQEQLGQLEAALRSGPGVITQAVVGLGGIGKSELALQYAERHQGAYRLVWWITAEIPEQIQAGLAGLGRALCAGVASTAAAQAPAEEAEAWALAWLAAHDDWLVVFDNAADAEDLQPYLGRLRTGHVLVTSRRAVGWRDVGEVLRLEVLPRAEAVELLLEMIGTETTIDRAVAGELAAELGELPLALKQAGAYLAATPGMDPATYLDLLRTTPARALSADPRHDAATDRGVTRVWQVTCARIERINPRAMRLLHVLACYAPDDLPCEVLTGVEGTDAAAIADALGTLASYSMINRSRDGQAVSVHRLVQAVTLAALPDDARTVTRAVAADLLQAALPDNPEHISSWPTYARLLPHAQAVLDAGSDAMNAVLIYLNASGDYRTARTLQHRRYIVLNHALGPEHPETLGARVNLAFLTERAGDTAGAREQLAALLPVFEQVMGPKHPGTLIVRMHLVAVTGRAGDAVGTRDRYAALVPVAERVLGPEYPETLTIRADQASWTGQMGNAAGARDQLTALLPVFERVMGPKHPETLKVRANLTSWTGNAGDAAGARDQLAALLPTFEQVMGPKHPETLTARGNLASWTGNAGDAAGARDQLAALLPTFEQVMGPKHPGTLMARAGLAFWTGKAGDVAGARDRYTALVPVLERVLGPEHMGTMTARTNLAAVTAEAGDAAGARDQYEALLPVLERVMGPKHSEVLAARASLARWTKEAEERL